ncbi:MAG: hypothetical protein VX619_04270, partial [bacterium]|nr:hypothetical protein [bacterium]
MGDKSQNFDRPKAITFSMVTKEESLTAVQASLSELSRLLDTLGYDVAEELIQHKDVPTARTMIGSGKVIQLKALCLKLKV